MRLKITVTGIVQGVGFRPFIYRTAVKNNLKGYVKNKGDAGVEILLEGKQPEIAKFLKELRENKPPLAQIHEIITKKAHGKETYGTFKIHKSSSETELSGSVIPPDVAICSECLKELRRNSDPRHDYFFITCTDCGPRFTIIEKLPYDRDNTTMQAFRMCAFCRSEYENPLNRRFHAQTVACPKCGPSAYLTTNTGKPVASKNPIREAGKLISEGKILAIKGYGGFHVAASTTKDAPLKRLRKVKHRSQKPFAIMARSLDAIKTFAEVNPQQEALLTSHARPIVLLNKSKNYYLSELVSPELHNIGVMLPYTGLHYMLFDEVDDAAFVMTSANPPSQPIIKDNEEALAALGQTVDYFLFHNRQIAHRCDDSVIRTHNGNVVFLRRSRGYAPAPIRLKRKTRKCVLGIGGELNNTACILNEDKAFITQHIGDVENIETKQFLEKAATHLIQLTNSKIQAIACDLHPKFTTTKLAQTLAEQNNWQLHQIQHHQAHITGLMAEHDIDEMIGVCCDGYGYGPNGEAWGGEILFCTREEAGFKRIAHLEKQPLVGGDLAAYYPLRMAAAMLAKKSNIQKWLMENAHLLPHGKKEAQILLHQLQKGKGLIETTSCGRVLDAVAAVLGVCVERTYEGEPAMKLESTALRGKDVLKLKPAVTGSMLDTTSMLLEVFEKRDKFAKADLAYSAIAYLARGLAEMAIEKAQQNAVKAVGFSGGVACNELFTAIMRKTIETAGLSFIVHEALPPGDGGLSFGQAAAVGFFRT
ncbi:MAG: carbamoyltransferase HypF [Candidatus Bathyarchaeia archaeon]